MQNCKKTAFSPPNSYFSIKSKLFELQVCAIPQNFQKETANTMEMSNQPLHCKNWPIIVCFFGQTRWKRHAGSINQNLLHTAISATIIFCFVKTFNAIAIFSYRQISRNISRKYSGDNFFTVYEIFLCVK